MANTKATFKQADLTRCLKAAVNADMPVARWEIKPDGTFVFFANDDEKAEGTNPCDRLLNE